MNRSSHASAARSAPLHSPLSRKPLGRFPDNVPFGKEEVWRTFLR
jgi:hypothetical protein